MDAAGDFLTVFMILISLVGITWYLVERWLDHDRIRTYVDGHGNTFIEAHWAPFGPGWLGAKGDRIYVVRYFDRDGIEHATYCKTSAIAGVYFTEDRIIQYAPPEDETEALRAENRRLREEVRRLQRSPASAGETAIKEFNGGSIFEPRP